PAGWLLAGEALPPVGTWTPDLLRSAVETAADPAVKVGVVALVAGAAAVALWLLVELLGALFLVTGRKTVVGTNAAAQMALAAALLVIVNVVAFGTYWRFDLTRDKQFTFA